MEPSNSHIPQADYKNVEYSLVSQQQTRQEKPPAGSQAAKVYTPADVKSAFPQVWAAYTLTHGLFAVFSQQSVSKSAADYRVKMSVLTKEQTF